MSKTYEVRVRPVVRYNVTVYQGGTDADGSSYGSCETIGEFANEDNANMVAMSLRVANEPVRKNNQFIVIRAHDYTAETEAYYAQDLAEAEVAKVRLDAETGREWRIAQMAS